jgi:hypothetical protein
MILEDRCEVVDQARIVRSSNPGKRFDVLPKTDKGAVTSAIAKRISRAVTIALAESKKWLTIRRCNFRSFTAKK